MKKNGFTLVELLAAFVIMAIIATITTVSYANYIASSKEKSYKEGEKTARAAAESFLTYCATSPFANSSCQNIPNVGETIDITLNVLVDQGFMKNIVDQGNNGFCSGSVKVTNNSTGENNDLSYKVCLTCSDFQSADCE